MKKLSVVAVCLAILALSFTPVEVLQIGASMPKADVKMKDVITGNEVSLADLKGENGILVMFSCNTCPYVVKNEDRTREILGFASSKNIGVAILNSNEAQRGKDDSDASMKAYAKVQGYKWNYVVDKNHVVADAFGATRTPECYLFDKDGILVYHGAIDDSPANANAVKRVHLKEAINEMTLGKEVSTKTTKSIGCAIKRI